ncbi:MAG: MATE family efflux transporter [Treponema sp.]
MKFGTTSFYKRALSIALPVMAQLLIQNLVSLIDNFMVAGLGDIKMSGVNVAGQINFVFLVLINNVLCNGGGIFMSQYKGACDKNGMQQVFRYKLLVCLTAGAGFTVFCAVNPVPVLGLMVRGNSAAAEIVAQAAAYEHVIAWTWIPMVITTVITSSLRETGEVRVPLIISVAATLVNTIGNYILIYGHFGAPRLEVTGAAIATIIARSAEVLTFIIYINVKRPDFFTHIRDIFKVRLSLVGTILIKSAMIAVSEMTWVGSETISTALYNSRGGAEIVSGMAAGFAIANLFFVSFSGIFTATGVIMGTTLGAGKLEEARVQKNWIESGSVIFGIFFGLLGCASILLIPLVYANLSAAARAVSRGLVFTAAAYMPLWCLANAQFAVSRTGGDTTMGVIVDLTANLLIYLPGMFLLTKFTALGPVAMYAIVKLSDVEKVIVASVWLKKERWLKNLAEENAV